MTERPAMELAHCHHPPTAGCLITFVSSRVRVCVMFRCLRLCDVQSLPRLRRGLASSMKSSCALAVYRRF